LENQPERNEEKKPIRDDPIEGHNDGDHDEDRVVAYAIEIFTDSGDLSAAPGYCPVEKIREKEGCNKGSEKRQNGMGMDENEKKGHRGNRADAKEGEFVREVYMPKFFPRFKEDEMVVHGGEKNPESDMDRRARKDKDNDPRVRRIHVIVKENP
jgi:hypothetical protein